MFAGAGGEAAAGRVQVPGPHSRVQGAVAERRGSAATRRRGPGPAGAVACARGADARPPTRTRRRGPAFGRRAGELARRPWPAAEPAAPSAPPAAAAAAAERGPGGRAAVGQRGAPAQRRRAVVPFVRGRRVRRAGPVRRAVQRVAAVRAAALQHRRQVVREANSPAFHQDGVSPDTWPACGPVASRGTRGPGQPAARRRPAFGLDAEFWPAAAAAEHAWVGSVHSD